MLDPLPIRLVVVLLGATQIVGYGTLYYAYPILAPFIAAELGWREDAVFGVLSAALLVGCLMAPQAGRLADRIGAARMMTIGSVAASAAMLILALAPGPVGFFAGVIAVQLASNLVFYAAAFVVLVQAAGDGARLRITHLTLIAGFASTLFWPLTSNLAAHFTWREIYCGYAVLNLVVCAPAHAILARRAHHVQASAPQDTPAASTESGTIKGKQRKIFVLLLVGFAVQGFVLSAILVHMVPTLESVGLGASALLVAALFGPAQVASRFVNMIFGRNLGQIGLAIIAASMMPLSAIALASTAPWLPGAIAFVILFGFGSGLNSIVGGTLPLALFGAKGYGALLGWTTSARQFAGAFAPFALSAVATSSSTITALWMVSVLGIVGIAAFVAIALVVRR